MVSLFYGKISKSIIWFLTFYLTGAYIGKYRVDYNGFKKYIHCFIYGAIFFIASYLYFKIYMREYYFFIGNKKIEIPIILIQMFSEIYCENYLLFWSFSF